MGIQRQCRFRLLEQFANHTGHVLVPWFNDKAMAGGGGEFDGMERKEEYDFKKKSIEKSKSFKDRLNLATSIDNSWNSMNKG